ncbi:electron transport complex subunit RsxD [Vibrio sp. HA2012]|uniref:electron transport complex subunit RsxD n=1 Tax=Vibrio sp. HA2012 TaxID=1971595 RepID=UPI000C2C17D0|nr:electron transport complex subunit RsxD [Vibrio sp. HA2012]PJC85364.1 electron transport complex subunit RsxD [Vibrio sp. HA2012]
MAFFIASSPHTHSRKSTPELMKWVVIAALPGLLAQTYFFGWGTLIQLILAFIIAGTYESIIMLLRKRSPSGALRDYSVFVTAWLLAVAIPPLSPWWMLVIGLFFAVVIAKHLYGGLGQNPFNPAMVGYVVLLISFPLQMTSWLMPQILSPDNISLNDALMLIITGFDSDGYSLQQVRAGIDGITMATPLDAFKTAIKAGSSSAEALAQPQFSRFAGIGWEWVNLAYLLGGLLLIRMRIIQWYIPAAMLGSILLCSGLGYLLVPEIIANPILHLFSGATMLGAFFIATDPVTASTTIRGRLMFGLVIGCVMFIIRTWGGFPDGVAFSVLLANMTVPLIDYYTKPRTYGH